MKKVGKIISYIFSAFVILFSLVFIVIEGYNLFSADWTLYENATNGFIRYLCRFILAILGIVIGIFTYISIGKKSNKTLLTYLYFGSLAFFISSMIISFFATNYLDILFCTIPILYFLGITLYFLGISKENKKNKA